MLMLQKNLYSLTNDPTKFIKDNFKLNIPSIPSTSNGNTFNNDMSFEINLPNVTNYEQFIYTMQRDKRFEKNCTIYDNKQGDW